jgi:hypothetical protein
MATMTAGNTMHLKKELASIGQILMEHWDPIGVRDVEAAKDEYDRYVPAILGMLNKGTSVIKMAEHLDHIQIDEMGLAATPERSRSVAEQLARMRASWR